MIAIAVVFLMTLGWVVARRATGRRTAKMAAADDRREVASCLANAELLSEPVSWSVESSAGPTDQAPAHLV